MSIKGLYRLTKPGVTYGNLITTIAGYLFAADGSISWRILLALTLGTWAIIASACVINNYLDQDIDSLMERTKKRPILTGEVSPMQALVLGILLGATGSVVLALFTNWWVVGTGVFGWIVYVWFYGALGKRKSVHGTLIGSISGAIPILAGYLAVSAQLDLTAVLLFLILFFWQEPEFYSISIFRRKEYAKAGVPVSAVVRGAPRTVRHIFVFTLLTTLSFATLALSELTSWTMWFILLILSIRWLNIAAEGFKANDVDEWARKNFHYSLIILVVFSIIISINPYLP